MSIRGVLPRIGGDSSSGAEDDLMVDIASGSQTAFAQLYDLTCARVFGLILSVIESRPSAEDVLQETYVHVWAHAREFSAYGGSASTWIAETAHRRAIELTRATGSTPARGTTA
ncbi:hypothetical protein HWD99_17690 [Microbacterium sp. C5A9]|uniref:sigma factor n=1 Tax=Microbacterium sp. C5A9 TaxID=2736663 RepID=UPI001F520F2E|nr:sigma factor [Microbacterium sp. C5A9]MCI1020463.1 hypothetical protein [Microbacterium sp. C5A9]